VLGNGIAAMIPAREWRWPRHRTSCMPVRYRHGGK